MTKIVSVFIFLVAELDGVEPKKQGSHETLVAVTIAPTSNDRRSRTDARRDLRFAECPRDIVYSNPAEFGKPALESYEL